MDFEDADAVASCIEWMRQNPNEIEAMGRRAREAFIAKYSWDAEFNKFLALI